MEKTSALSEKYLLRIFRFTNYVVKGLNTPEQLVSYVNDLRDDFCEERINLLEEVIND